MPVEFTQLCEHLKNQLIKKNGYLFIFDNVKNFDEIRDKIMIWSINIKCLITTEDEALKKILPKTIIKNLLNYEIFILNFTNLLNS